LNLQDLTILNDLNNICNYLFPDIIVMQNDYSINSAHVYVENEIKRLNLQLNYLENKDINYIKNMSLEKYRKSLFDKNIL
jgi:hypothetical protein